MHGNHRRMETTNGNHKRVETTHGNHGRVETTGGWKPQESSNHRRVETTENDEKLHTVDSNSLVIISIWAYYTLKDGYK